MPIDINLLRVDAGKSSFLKLSYFARVDPIDYPNLKNYRW